MGDICLSVAPILRCQSLSRLEAGILLLPPGVEIIFASVLLWVKRGSDKWVLPFLKPILESCPRQEQGGRRRVDGEWYGLDTFGASREQQI